MGNIDYTLNKIIVPLFVTFFGVFCAIYLEAYISDQRDRAAVNALYRSISYNCSAITERVENMRPEHDLHQVDIPSFLMSIAHQEVSILGRLDPDRAEELVRAVTLIQIASNNYHETWLRYHTARTHPIRTFRAMPLGDRPPQNAPRFLRESYETQRAANVEMTAMAESMRSEEIDSLNKGRQIYNELLSSIRNGCEVISNIAEI